MKTLITILILWLVALSSSAQNQIIPESFLGEWSGEGTLMGQPANFEMKWESVLDQQFIRLTFQNSIPDQFSFSGHAYYHIESDSTATGTWFDTRGYIFPIDAILSQNSIISSWGTAEIEQGRTDYIVQSDGTIRVTDYVLKDNVFQKFGEAIYRRQ